MVNYILFLNVGKHRERGAALIVAVLVLLSIALLGLSLAGQQVLAHYQQISLDEQRLRRQMDTELLFEQVAQALEVNSRLQGAKGNIAPVHLQAGTSEYALHSEVYDVECLHDFATLSHCWQVQVHQAGSGFIRKRMLVVPDEDCSAPYWFPPAGRIAVAPGLPPTDSPPDDGETREPIRPPLKPSPGGRLP